MALQFVLVLWKPLLHIMSDADLLGVVPRFMHSVTVATFAIICC